MILPVRLIQLAAGRTAQEYNQRKKRKGAFWEDRYHATIIESGEHLLRCIVYIDMNMVRAGVVDHPEQWIQSGYNEIQTPRKKCILIDYDTLRRLCGFDNYNNFKHARYKWISTALSKNDLYRESQWTNAIDVGSESFVKKVKKEMRSSAIGRDIIQSKNNFELREPTFSYNRHFSVKNIDIGLDNTYFLNKNDFISK